MNKIVLINKIRKAIKNYPSAILDYRRYFKNLKSGKSTASKGPMFYKLRNGLKFITRKGTGDIFALCEIAATNVYHLEKIKPTDIVIDIGAHIGVFSVMASKRAKKVIAIEPVSNNFELLKKNIEINRIGNIIPIKKAISSKTGKTKIYTGDNTVAHSLISKDKKNSSEEIETLSLPDLIKTYKLKKIDFLKMDCEGAEHEILNKMPLSVLKKIKRIHMESHELDSKRTRESIRIFLEKNGFSVSSKWGMFYAFRNNLSQIKRFKTTHL